jgi:hypothetical protein
VWRSSEPHVATVARSTRLKLKIKRDRGFKEYLDTDSVEETTNGRADFPVEGGRSRHKRDKRRQVFAIVVGLRAVLVHVLRARLDALEIKLSIGFKTKKLTLKNLLMKTWYASPVGKPISDTP